MTEFLREINWSPLWISLKTGLAATVIAFFWEYFAPEDHEAEAGSQSSTGRDPYSSASTSSYSGWIFSATDLQPEKALRKLSFG
mgnify:CR=1 FL=1